MVRRVAAAVVLLTFAVFMLLLTPKAASAVPRPMCAMAPEKEAEQRKLRGSLDAPPEEADTSAHLDAVTAPVLAPRRAQLIDEPAPARETVDVTATAAESDTPARAAHPQRAREAWSPASALTPDATTLQTFRC
ncbi:hypothetical protein ACIRYZ_22625 [Kitasatospora sp. NPDC101155]|uniref:hypothetical protein n=1 Tax=Kitasatospora sp. NPDC101155 TaxID=3364097 RepID=UPI003819651B